MDELDLLKELGRDTDAVDPDARARARLLLEERIRAASSSIDLSRTEQRRSRRAMLAAALVASLAVLIVAIQLVLPSGSGGPAPAQATLEGLARVAATTKSEMPIPGSYYYVRNDGLVLRSGEDLLSGGSWSFIVPVTRETWLASDGSGRILEGYGEPRFVSEADRIAWRSAGSPTLLPSGPRKNKMYGPGALAPRDLGALATEPTSLAAQISSGGIATELSDSVHNPLGVIAALLGEVPTSPELRSSLFLATAELPGIESLGRLSDPSGRVGIGVAIVERDIRTELIFDATTSALLSTSVVRVTAGGSRTQILFETTYRQRSTVPSIHARPR